MSVLALDIEIDGVTRSVALERNRDGGYIARLDGRALAADVLEPIPGVLSLLVRDGGTQRAYRCVRTVFADETTVWLIGSQHRAEVRDPRSLRARRRSGDGGNGAVQIKSSMPGRVARVLAAPGDEVAAQQGIVVVEAMKMQNELKSPRAARVTEIRVAAGDKVAAGQVLAVLE